MQSSVLKFYKDAKPTSAELISNMSYSVPQWERIEVILKVTERCNIDCTYCYFFNSTNQDFKNHPAYIKEATIKSCAEFLVSAVKQSGAKKLQIDFHGGEPLMMKKNRFDEMCQEFKTQLSELVELTLALQTNAMLIDEDWIKIFARHNVYIGISLDGPKNIHDINRIDHKGNGTYDETIRGLKLIQNSNIAGFSNKVGAICVINPETDAKEIFDHFVDDLKLSSLHYLLPMYDHDDYNKENDIKITKYLCDLFDAWASRKNPEIRIRYFTTFMAHLVGGVRIISLHEKLKKSNYAFTLASNGDIGPADDIRNTFPQLFWSKANVFDTSLEQFTKIPIISNYMAAAEERHPDCLTCCWGNICDGGDIVGSSAFRYSRDSGLRNKSIYCNSIQDLLTHMTKFLIDSGVSFDHISKALIS